MNAELILKCKSFSDLIIEERDCKDIVVGVPHHAPAGVGSLPCPEHQESDENAGYLGRYISKKLECCSIIACNYRVDSNKCPGSDYSTQIAKWRPKFLVEIHGHGGSKANYRIEISSGNPEHNKYSMELAAKLQEKISRIEQLKDKDLSISGKFEDIYFQAANTASIVDKRWVSFHIELPLTLRKSPKAKFGRPPEIGYRFCDCLIEALNEICRGNHT